MANEFFTILTATGRNKLAAATATATPLALTQMAVGDGDNGAYYSPTEAQTVLKHEVWRGAINHLAVDANNPNWIVAELVIPDDVGGFYIREVGLFDSAGAMIAVGKFPESYKPTLAAGSNKQLYVRMILEVSNTTAVTLLVDPSVVLATRKYCDDKVTDELNKRDGKQSVRVATTTAIALAGLQTIDGVVLVAGDRVLVKDQAAGAENGIYVAAAAAWTRATDADSGTKLNAGALVPVEAGTVNADTIWMLKTDGAIIVGATPIAFQWAGGLNAPTQPPGDNSAKIANTSFVQAAIAALVASSPAALDTLNELAAALGNDANFATTVTNALATKATQAGVQAQTWTAFTTSGATGAFALTPNPAITAYAPGLRFRVKFHTTGNRSDTMNVSALGAKAIKQYDSTGTKVAPVIARQLADIEYDGADFVILDPLPSTCRVTAYANTTRAVFSYARNAAPSFMSQAFNVTQPGSTVIVQLLPSLTLISSSSSMYVECRIDGGAWQQRAVHYLVSQFGPAQPIFSVFTGLSVGAHTIEWRIGSDLDINTITFTRNGTNSDINGLGTQTQSTVVITEVKS